MYLHKLKMFFKNREICEYFENIIYAESEFEFLDEDSINRIVNDQKNN